MAEQLLFLADNLFDTSLYPDHTGSADSEATGYEWWHVATGRRSSGDRWSPATANADHYVQVRCDQLRGANCLVIDRGGNHLGQRFVLYGSDDNFTTSRSIFDITLPSVPGGTPDGALGCVTGEGAWIKTFSADAFNDWRLYSYAMGSGVTQQLVGVWLGLAWLPTDYVIRFPLQSEGFGISQETIASPKGWRGRGQLARMRRGTLNLALPNEAAVDMLRYQVLDLFGGADGQLHPAWLCWQRSAEPSRAMLVSCDGDLDYVRGPEWHPNYPALAVPFVEEQAA